MHTVGIRLGMEAGGFISTATAAKEAVRDLDREIQKAQKDGDGKKVGELYFAKHKMDAATSGFQRDVNSYTNNPIYSRIMKKQDMGQALTKSEEKYVTRLETLNDTIKKMTEALNNSIKDGASGEDIRKQIYGFEEQVKDFHKAAAENETQGTGRGSSAGEAVKSIALNQLVGAIKSGMDVWVSSLDRTAVIGALGNGDVLGGSLAESQRRASKTTGALGMAGSAAQGIGLALAPFTGGISLLVGTGVNLITQVASSLTVAQQKLYANRIAYAGLWDDKKDQAMNLAAVMGNPSNVRGTWGTAASVAERYGFTAEEGAEMLKAAAYQGLGASAADRVFNYERGTGADRGVLSSVSMMSERYNGGDALRSGWAGLQASGMKSGQYTEYLRAMQRVMEDGISKGFVRSSDQVARNLTMLAQMTDNNPLWQGEHGAQRLMQIMSGFEGATALQDSNDMFAYSAAKTVLEGKGRSTDIVDVQKYLENPDDLVGLYNEFIKQIKDVEGDNRLEIVSRLIKRFGLNYTTADALYRSNGTSTEEVNRLLSRQAGIPTPSSNELRYSIETMNVRNLIIEAGQDFYDTETTKALELTRKELEETVSGNLPLTGRARQEDRARREEEAHEINDRIRRARGDTAFYRSFFSSGEDDRQARERLRGYLNEDNHPAFRAFEEASAILRAFTPEQRRAVDESNAINRAIPNVMTDRTGQQLLEAIRELADQVDVTINVE